MEANYCNKDYKDGRTPNTKPNNTITAYQLGKALLSTYEHEENPESVKHVPVSCEALPTVDPVTREAGKCLGVPVRCRTGVQKRSTHGARDSGRVYMQVQPSSRGQIDHGSHLSRFVVDTSGL